MPPNKKDSVFVPSVKTASSEAVSSLEEAAEQPMDGLGEQSGNEKHMDASELNSAAQALIGHQLRTLYGEIVREPVPDQLLKLLQDLERKERE